MPSSPSKSPRRRPLHERSDSQTNSRHISTVSTPSIRMVTNSDDDDGGGPGGGRASGSGSGSGGGRSSGGSEAGAEILPDRAYTASPYPTQPSQVLSPRSRRPAGLALRDDSHRISTALSSPPLDFDVTAFDTDPTLKPASPPSPAKPAKSQLLSPPKQHGPSSPSNSPVVGVALSGSSPPAAPARIPQIPQQQESPNPGSSLPSSPRRLLSPQSYQDPQEDPRLKRISLASSASSDTLQGRQHIDRSARSSVNVSPLPKSPARSTFSKKSVGTSPLPPPKDPFRSLSSQSIPGRATQESSEFGTASIQYPVVRAPTTIGSWADSVITIPKKRPRMPERDSAEPLRLNPVTPPPEARLQVRKSPPDLRRVGRKSIGDGFSVARFTPSSSMVVEASSSSPSDPQASTSRASKGKSVVRNWSYRDPLSATSDNGKPKGKRRSILSRDPNVPAPLRLRPSPSKSESSRSPPFPTISQFLKDTASTPSPQRTTRGSDLNQRSFYGRIPGPTSSGAPGSSTEEPTDNSSPPISPIDDNMPLGIFRPRSKKYQSSHFYDSEGPGGLLSPGDHSNIYTGTSAGPASSMGFEPLAGRQAAFRVSEANWPPRLQHDKRVTVLSLWEAPKIEPGMDDEAVCGPRNVQLYMFCFGFLIPIAWWVASFLPLPPNPFAGIDDEEKFTGRRSQFESHIARNCDPVDEMRYENARWWRNVNRIMSVVGLMLIGAIIALVVVASKTKPYGS